MLLQNLIDISYQPDPQQQTRLTLLQRSNGTETGGQTDGRTPYRYIDSGSVRKEKPNYNVPQKLKLRTQRLSKEANYKTQNFYRAMLCIRGTSHGPVSVRPSVRPSQVSVLLKRLNVGSHKQHRTIAQGSSILTPKISAKFHQDHPLRGRQMQAGWVEIGDFRQIAGNISKTVQGRPMVSVKVE